MGNSSSFDGNKSYVSMTEECRLARETIAVAREQYLEKQRKESYDQTFNFDEPDEDLSDEETKKYKYPFENFVMEGGGIKGIGYVGVCRVLEEHGILQQIKRFAGTSVGSITAAALAVGYNSYDINEILKVDFEKLLYDAGTFGRIFNLIKGYGLNPGSRFYQFMGDLIATKTGDPDITFAEVYNRFGKELCVVTVNVDTSEEKYCHVKTTPEMPIRLAVRMSMSIPGLFIPVTITENDVKSHYVDGGMYANYPINCYDGWFLSMNRRDRFLKKLQPIDNLQELMDNNNRFKHDPDQNKTIGAVVYSEGENELYRKMLADETGVLHGKLPDTKYASKYHENKRKEKIKSLEGNKMIEATEKFFQVIEKKDRNRDNIITRKEFRAAFNQKHFREEYQKVLFGEGCDVDTAFTAIDKNGNEEVTLYELISFVESAGISILENFKDHKRLDTSTVTKFLCSMVSGLTSRAGNLTFTSRDIARTIGISSWYITTIDFELEKGDIQMMIKHGEGSTKKYLRNYLERNSLEQLSDAELSNLEVPKGMSVSKDAIAEVIRI